VDDCVAVTCNFEAGTLCKYFSTGEPANDAGGRAKEKFRQQQLMDEWQAKYDAIKNPPKSASSASSNPLAALMGGRRKRQLGGFDPNKMIKLANLMTEKPKLPDYASKRKAWLSAHGHLGNSQSGISEPSSGGSSFAGAYLFPREYALLETNVEFDQPGTILFDAIEDGHGMQLSACCNYEDTCGYTSDEHLSTPLGWQQDLNITCPAGTNKVLFVCSNEGGSNQGACGVDNVRLDNGDCWQKFTKSGNVPEHYARMGNAAEVNTPMPEKDKQKLANSALAGGMAMLSGGDPSSALDAGLATHNAPEEYVDVQQG